MSAESTAISPAACKKIIADALTERGGLSARLSARTIGFCDLAWASCVFVTIHDWNLVAAAAEHRDDLYADLQRIARANGFRISMR